MRCVAILLCAIAALAPLGAAQTPSLLARAHQNIVGSVNVTSLVLEGPVAEQPFLPGTSEPFTGEWMFLIPAAYRTTLIDFGTVQFRGFLGDAALLGARSLTPTVKVNVGEPGASFVGLQRVLAARLLLGILALEEGPLPLKAIATSASQTLRVTGPGNFDCFLDLDPSTMLPLRVRYNGRWGFPPPDATRHASWHSDPPEDVEFTMAFGDRRLTDGVKLPHRVTTTARSLARGARSISEDFTFTKVFVNPPLTPADLSKAP